MHLRTVVAVPAVLFLAACGPDHLKHYPQTTFAPTTDYALEQDWLFRYVLIMGGWGNSKSLIARGNEHGKDLVERTQPKVQPGKRYHWKIQRQGGRIDWWVDGELFLSWEDVDPLRGSGNDYFGFNNWESDAWFDNLSITPL